MINESKAKKFCGEDISLIENYALAIADQTQTWCCHHILGEQHSKQYLKENGLYLKRPACELRFMIHIEHDRLHKQGVPRPDLKGVPLSEAHKQAISDALKGIGTKKVLQFTKSGEFVREWTSMTAIWQELGIRQSSICACCRDKRKSAGGYIWRYAFAE